MIRRMCLVIFLFTLLHPASLHAGVLGSVILKDGSIIHGEIVDMVEGKLQVKAAFGADKPFLIKWDEVVNIATSQPIVLVLGDDVKVTGTVEKGDLGTLRLTSKPLSEPIVIELASVTGINPAPLVPVKFKINLNLGTKFSSGNTDDAQINLLSGFVARSERLRLILDARYFYAEENDRVTDRNAFGTMDLNFFMTERLYWFLAVLMQQDTFDDLDLRTALTTGPGYQFIEKGDFSSQYLTNMTLQGDLGVGYLWENRKIDEDNDNGVYRWSLRWEWEPIKKLTIFHQQQGFPEVGDLSNYYLNTLQGIRFDIWKGISISGQVQWSYDNEPAEGSQKADTTVFFAIGYNYEN